MSARHQDTADLFGELAPAAVALLYQVSDRQERPGVRDLVALHEVCAIQTGFRPVATYRMTHGQALACYACNNAITAEPKEEGKP